MKQPSVPDDRLSSPEELVRSAPDLTDEEVKKVGEIWAELQLKYSRRDNTATNLEQLRDEALTRLAQIGLRASFDPSPCFYGEPPVIEIVGKTAGDLIYKYGFDHERKQQEVLEANKRGEQYRGQKETYNKRRDGST